MVISAVLMLLAASGDPPASVPAVDQAWTILKDGVESKRSETRTKAVEALALLPANRHAEQIACKALSDPSPGVRAAAATTLGQMDDLGARPELREALNDKEAKVVVAAANALYALRDPAAYEVYYELLTGDRKSSNGMVHSELNTLRDRREIERLAFETGVGFVPFGGAGWEAWKTVTKDDKSPVRAAAAEKLAHDADPKSATALVTACFDHKWIVRAAAVTAIAKRGDPTLLPSAQRLLSDGNNAVRFDAAAAVIRLSASIAGRPKSSE
jgi:HEAT repeat protein